MRKLQAIQGIFYQILGLIQFSRWGLLNPLNREVGFQFGQWFLPPGNPLRYWRGWLFRLLALLTTAVVLLTHALPPSVAQTLAVFFPSNPAVQFQTNGPARPATIGDWYTTATSSSSDRLHRFFISITEQNIADAGGSVRIGVRDGQSNGVLDEVDGRSLDAFSTADRSCPQGAGAVQSQAICDPTRFTLRDINDRILQTQIFPSGTAPGPDFVFAPVTTPGIYQVTSETGALPIFGDATTALNDDDNSFSIFVIGSTTNPALIGQSQGTFQRSEPNRNAPLIPFLPFFFLVGPDTNGLFLRNFDLNDPAPGGPPPGVDYLPPNSTTPILGTTSGNGLWNGAGAGLNTGGDTVPIPNPIAGAGIWEIGITDYNAANQTLLEANTSDGRRLVVFDSPPQRAGNFTVQHNRPPVRVQAALCYDVEISNLFFTSDIINLRIPNPPTGFTFQLRSGDYNTPLTDTDGDGNLDTGVLAAFSGRRAVALCAEPAPDAPREVTVQIEASSFMDRRVQQQFGRPDSAPVILRKQIRLDDANVPTFRLVKRIANVVRNGSVLPSVNFNQVIDDPNSREDNAPGWSQIPLLGITNLPITNPVQSGDEVTYRVYFLSDGGAPALSVSLCDLIPGGMTYEPETIRVQIGSGGLQPAGNFFSPLQPLPQNNSCLIQDNPNGAVIVELGDVSNQPGQNVGFIQFRTRVN